MSATSTSSSRVIADLRSWWREPRMTWWVLLVLALLAALRNPSALFTPQLWAEDGGIFLVQNDTVGLRAFFEPYVGYLHFLPRLTAFTASLILDPRWWPAFYNGVSYLIWVAVVARMFSRRLDLPQKPWLALAFFVIPHTGEVLFNLTNLQWVTAFVLIQQVLMIRPTTTVQRTGDLVLLFVTGLTGPFSMAFLPLFAWRWWRDRDRDSAVALLTVAVCAGIQEWFVIRTGPHWDYQASPVNWLQFFEISSRRLVVAPVLGNYAALQLPKLAIAAIGTALVAALFVWALRRHPRRLLRAQIILVFAIVLSAGFYRSRFDLWSGDHLVFSDRYFFIPRVLFVWLLVLEFDSVPRIVARFAQLICLALVLVHLDRYVLPAPPDYHWAAYCDAIRRGVPADIPTLPEGWTLQYPGRPLRK